MGRCDVVVGLFKGRGSCPLQTEGRGSCPLQTEGRSSFVKCSRLSSLHLVNLKQGEADSRTLLGIFIVQELCESRGGRPELSVLTSLLASVDVKIY